jgi:hypothetical protein
MFGPTVVCGVSEPEEKAVEVPKKLSAEIGLRNSWCEAGNLVETVPYALCDAYPEEIIRVAKRTMLSLVIFQSLAVDFPLKGW